MNALGLKMNHPENVPDEEIPVGQKEPVENVINDENENNVRHEEYQPENIQETMNVEENSTEENNSVENDVEENNVEKNVEKHMEEKRADGGIS